MEAPWRFHFARGWYNHFAHFARSDHVTSVPATFDFKSTVSNKRLHGLWRMMRGYRLIYIGALFFIGVGALMNTLTYVLLAYLIDEVLGKGIYTPTVLLWIALAFIGLALLQVEALLGIP